MFLNIKKIVTTLLLLNIIMIMQIGFADVIKFDMSLLNQGTFSVDSQLETNTKKVVVVQNGDKQSFYPFEDGATYPLVFGDGNYTISLFEQMKGNQYKALKQVNVPVTLANEESVYLSSNVKLPWKEFKVASAYAKGVLTNDMTDYQKAEVLYYDLINKFSYDYDKVNGLDGSYVASADETIQSMDGICIDFATVYASILREHNIPTKIVKGYKNDVDVYHAWNEVFLDGQWLIVDVTYNNAYIKAGYETKFIMSSEDYEIKTVY